MTMVIRVVQKAGGWLIELDGDYFGPIDSEDAAFTQANFTALKLQLDDFSADVRIEKQEISLPVALAGDIVLEVPVERASQQA